FPGKAFLRRLRNVLSNLECSNDYCQVTPEMKKDFFFWNKYLEHAKDVALHDILKIHTYKYIIESDASTGYGLGAFMPPKFIMLPTPTEFKGKNIAVLEILAITLAISTFLGELRNSAFVIRIDNTVAAYGLRDWSSKNKEVMDHIRLVAILAIENNLRFYVEWIPTNENSVADAISRNKLSKFKELAMLRGQSPNVHPEIVVWDARLFHL
ncbi:MAG: hypothetical protein GY714_24345, partial [Desulfobacterales bacterium]|nr:hypothetical protein [Desulfobacterales bacterium]